MFALGLAVVMAAASSAADLAGDHAARASTGVPTAALPAVRRHFQPAVHSICDHPPRSALAYGWPVKPFHRQHPIRGFFGDPRTLGLEQLGSDRRGSPGSFTFHNGVDISAPVGTPVYPVVSGVAHVKSGDRIGVTTDDGRTFQYVHIKPLVQPGQPVIADTTVLGTVMAGFKHVHLTEIDHFRAHNPLDPGHLEPYRDHTVPDVDSVSFTTVAGAPLDPEHLYGRIHIAAEADDVTPVPVPGHWFGFPVTPALITWRLATAGGLTVLHATAADFRRTEPLNVDFWRTYAAGTYQNFPDFTHHLYWHVPGRYLFDLTPSLLRTGRLRNGTYRITVSVADTCGNRSTLSEAIRIDNQPVPAIPVARLKRAYVE